MCSNTPDNVRPKQLSSEVLPPDHLMKLVMNERVLALNKVGNLEKENRQLREQLEHAEEQTNILMGHYQKETKRRRDDMHALERQLIRSNVDAKKNEGMLIETSDATIQQLQDSNRYTKARLARELKWAKMDIEELRKDCGREGVENMKSQISQLEQTINSLQKQHDDERKELKRLDLFERAELQSTFSSKVNEIRNNASEIICKELGSALQDILSDNQHISKQFRDQLQVMEKMQKEKIEMDRTLGEFRRELELCRDREHEYIKKNLDSAAERRRLESENVTMKDKIMLLKQR